MIQILGFHGRGAQVGYQRELRSEKGPPPNPQKKKKKKSSKQARGQEGEDGMLEAAWRSAFKSGLVPATAPLIAQLVKNLLAMQETPVGFLGQEDPLGKG